MNNFCIVTTINLPTKAIEVLYEKFGKNLIVVGDEKTPKDWNYKDAQYILDLPVDKNWYAGYAPRNSYARKNLGYLEAMRQGAKMIYESDDDNIPNENWQLRVCQIEASKSYGEGWYNVYEAFGKSIWPRGFSLKHLHKKSFCDGIGFVNSSIQQGLADGEPDVDAIYRLTSIPNNYFRFNEMASLYLNVNTWCPFNSQSTWFFPKAYPLMYLPIHANFRMCDIWRSFVAQKCLWYIEDGVTFHSPSEVFQDRNEHDLLKDFEDEIHGYLKNDKMVEILSSLELKNGEENICDNMVTCYTSLVVAGILPAMELRSLNTWIKDYENIKKDEKNLWNI